MPSLPFLCWRLTNYNSRILTITKAELCSILYFIYFSFFSGLRTGDRGLVSLRACSQPRVAFGFLFHFLSLVSGEKRGQPVIWELPPPEINSELLLEVKSWPELSQVYLPNHWASPIFLKVSCRFGDIGLCNRDLELRRKREKGYYYWWEGKEGLELQIMRKKQGRKGGGRREGRKKKIELQGINWSLWK